MRTMTRILALSGMALGGLMLSATVNAAVLKCPDVEGTRMELSNYDGTPTCLDFGSGPQEQIPAGFDLLWKIDFNDDGTIAEVTGPGPDPFLSFTGGGEAGKTCDEQACGSFALIAGLTEHLLAFKFGNVDDPNWFVFEIGGMTTADWNFFGRTALSHVGVYGPPPTMVPEPATLALFGLGLLGLACRARRRQTA